MLPTILSRAFVLDKIKKTVESCKTKDQIIVARNYLIWLSHCFVRQEEAIKKLDWIESAKNSDELSRVLFNRFYNRAIELEMKEASVGSADFRLYIDIPVMYYYDGERFRLNYER